MESLGVLYLYHSFDDLLMGVLGQVVPWYGSTAAGCDTHLRDVLLGVLYSIL